jgi:hypothetical protein
LRALGFENFRYTSKRFGLWRIAFGIYLFYYYLRLFPFARELFTQETGMPGADAMSAASFFPQAILNFDSSLFVYSLLSLCAICSLMIVFGFKRRLAATILWPLVMWMYNRNKMTDSPEYSFINWLIFISIFIPTGEAYAVDGEDSEWKFPPIFYWGAWIVLTFGYLAAGVKKYQLHDAVWLNGSAMYYVLSKDNARWAWFGNFFDQVPLVLFYPLTWGGMVFEMFAPLFAFFRRTRFWWWIFSTFTHLILLFFVNLAEVSFGMLVFHLFVFDENWLSSNSLSRLKAVGFKAGTQ